MDDVTKTAIERWLIKASNDLRTAKTMLALEQPTTDTVCFHSQQCVEKCLKAFLTYADRHIEKTHDLAKLVEICREIDEGFENLIGTANQLADYAVTTRYPDFWREIPIKEAKIAVKLAENAKNFVQKKLGIGKKT